MAALSMTSGRSGKLAGGSGKDQPAINRRTRSALPTTIKYLAMGTADSSRELGNRGPPHRALTGEDDASTRRNSPSPFPRRPLHGRAEWREPNRAPFRSPALPA